MKRSTKTISIILVFFLIIAIVIIGRTMIGNHFKKKFSKRPPPGIIVTEVIEKEFSEKIETFGTAISKNSKTFKIKKDDLLEDLKLKSFVKKGETLIKLKSENIVAPFSGMLGYTGLTEDILVSNNIIIITLDDNSTIYSDIKIPENYSPFIKKGLPVDVKITSYKDKVFEVFHYEWDSFNYDSVMEKKHEIEYFVINQDWDDIAESLWSKKNQWINLDFFEQTKWRTDFFGLSPEKFKNVIWES